MSIYCDWVVFFLPFLSQFSSAYQAYPYLRYILHIAGTLNNRDTATEQQQQQKQIQTRLSCTTLRHLGCQRGQIQRCPCTAGICLRPSPTRSRDEKRQKEKKKKITDVTINVHPTLSDREFVSFKVVLWLFIDQLVVSGLIVLFSFFSVDLYSRQTIFFSFIFTTIFFSFIFTTDNLLKKGQ